MNVRRFWFGLFVAAVFLTPLLSAASEPPSPDPRRRRGAKSGGQDSSKLSVQQAIANMRSPDKRLRLAALKRIAGEKGKNIHKWIVDSAQNDPEARIRYQAVKILEKRREKASIPVLERIAKSDKDERVSEAAGAAYIEATGKKLSARPASARPASRADTPPPAAAPPPPPPGPPPEQKGSKNEMGHELPPGYEDGWEMDQEKVTDKKDRVSTHHGFMPVVGWDGTMGAPRDTLARTGVGLIVGLEAGSYDALYSNTRGAEDVKGDNTFSMTDFSLVLTGKYSPVEFLELGVDLEVLTVEKLSHKQSWYSVDNEGEYMDDIAVDAEDSDNPYQDDGYGGAALGFVSANIKLLFARTEGFRMGLAVRGLFPSHTGDRVDRGIGAQSLYTIDEPLKYTKDGLLWGIEPGIVASYMPADSLTIYADITFLMTILTYDLHDTGGGGTGDDVTEMTALSLYLIPHLGAQYRLLDGDLGFQLALAPSVYLGTKESAGFASMGLVPGVLYRIVDTVDLSLTASIEIGSNAPGPLLCPGEDLGTDGRDEYAPCGIGRRFGMALAAGYDF